MSMTLVAAKAGQFILQGTCLALGFWIAKKLTETVDERLFIFDSRKKKEVTNVRPEST